MMLKKMLSIVLAISFLSILIPVGNVIASPVVTVQPDTMFSPSETQYINGTGFQANTTVRVDLIFPSGSTIEGIASSTTNTDGNFSMTFMTPDVVGTGYVKVLCGADIVSTLVTFEGVVTYDLSVSYPDEVYAGQPANFTIDESDLDDKNYIIDVEIIDSDDDDSWEYFVLHDGEARMPIIFEDEGDYLLNITIENTGYQWTEEIEVLETPDDPDDSGSGSTNITWNVIASGNTYTINIFKEGSGYLQAGTIRIVRPDGTMQDVPIVSGSATITTTDRGQYQMQYTDGEMLFLEYFTYNPVISLSATAFSVDGQTTVSLKIDGNTPTEPITINVQTPTGQNMITLVNGLGTYTTGETGGHTFSLDYNGAMATTTVAYTEEYIVEDYRVTLSSDYSYIYVTGKVVGETSGDGKSGLRVTITCNELGYEDRVTTSSAGSFRTTIPVSKDQRGGWNGGRLVTVTYEFGDTEDDASLTMKRDAVGELWWLWAIIIIILILIAWDRDVIYNTIGMFPSSKSKGQDSSGGGGNLGNFP